MNQVKNFMTTLNMKLEPPLQAHMKNVYACVALSTLSAAVGGYVHVVLRLMTGGFLSAIGSMGFMLALMFTPDDGKNAKKRIAFLIMFAFLSGVGLGRLLDVAMAIEPAIIPTAFFGTCLVFTCFTLASMMANQRQYIYLGGTLLSILSVMTVGTLLNIFLGSYLLFKVHVYLTVLVMCAFILYDTQMIMEKRRNGDKDYVWHSVSLFLDLIQIFRAILIILAEKEQRSKKK